jgi:hypothetical protein
MKNREDELLATMAIMAFASVAYFVGSILAEAFL